MSLIELELLQRRFEAVFFSVLIANEAIADLNRDKQPDIIAGYVEKPGSVYLTTGHGRTFPEAPGTMAKAQFTDRPSPTSMETAGPTSWRRVPTLPMASGSTPNRVAHVNSLDCVISYSVSQRTREIGVRMALDAALGSVYNIVLREAARLTATRIVVGLTGSIAVPL